MNDLDKAAEWAEAKQWLQYTMRDLEKAINCSGSDEPRDIEACDLNFKGALRSLENACVLLGMEVTIPALEDKL